MIQALFPEPGMCLTPPNTLFSKHFSATCLLILEYDIERWYPSVFQLNRVRSSLILS